MKQVSQQVVCQDFKQRMLEEWELKRAEHGSVPCSLIEEKSERKRERERDRAGRERQRD